MNNWFDISAKKHGTGAGPAVIHIFDEIGAFGVSAEQFALQLKNLGEVREIELHINSPGGDVFDGLAIYNILSRHEATVTVFVDGLAASIASVVAMSGDDVVMPENALMMMHRPTVFAFGDADKILKKAEILQKTEPGIIAAYRNKTGLADSVISDMLAAETWLPAAEAVAQGFADRIEEPMKIAAHFDLEQFNHVPDHYRKEKALMPNPKNSATGDTKTAPPTDKTSEPAPEAALITSVESTVANLADIKAALPNADAEFYVKCLDDSMTVEQAKNAWIERQQATNEAQTQEIEKLKSKKQDPPGVDPLNHDAAGDGTNEAAGDAQARWNEAITSKVKDGMSRSAAAAAVNREDPQLREDMVTETNIAQGRARVVA